MSDRDDESSVKSSMNKETGRVSTTTFIVTKSLVVHWMCIIYILPKFIKCEPSGRIKLNLQILREGTSLEFLSVVIKFEYFTSIF